MGVDYVGFMQVVVSENQLALSLRKVDPRLLRSQVPGQSLQVTTILGSHGPRHVARLTWSVRHLTPASTRPPDLTGCCRFSSPASININKYHTQPRRLGAEAHRPSCPRPVHLLTSSKRLFTSDRNIYLTNFFLTTPR